MTLLTAAAPGLDRPGAQRLHAVRYVPGVGRFDGGRPGIRERMTASKNSGIRTYDGWLGRHAYDVNGDKIGKIDHIFYDDRTQRPEWLAVKTGLFGTKTTFVPITGSAQYEDENLQVPFEKDFVKEAPRLDVDEEMTHLQEQELWSYYGFDYAGTSAADSFGYGATYGQPRADEEFTSGWESSSAPRRERLRRYEDRRTSSRR